MVEVIKDFKEIIPKYDLFIVDIYGVIHDGDEVYPAVHENMAEIKRQGKDFVFLSNAPRRANVAKEKLLEFGVKDFNFIMTSGEFAFQHFKELEEKGEIKKYFYFGPEKDRGLLDESKHIMVDSPAEADLAISTGLEPHQLVDDVMDHVRAVLAAGIEIYCINPDRYVKKKSGKSHICAGAIADRFIELDGSVKYFGKPHIPIYNEVLEKFPNISKDKILCIGDGMETDITGAVNSELDSVLITSGMHLENLSREIGVLPSEEKLQLLCEEYGVRPKYIAALF